MKQFIILTILYLIFGGFAPAASQPAKVVALAAHEFPLTDRYTNSFVNDVFKDNILLAIDYATGKKLNPQSINWSTVDKPFEYEIILKPGETFAFHDDVLPQYAGRITRTTNAHFNSTEGFKSDGYLVGDGVCHLASLMYWVAKDAGLSTLAPTRHDFAPVPDVPREYGVSIYNNQEKSSGNEMQNLYITNNKKQQVTFLFKYDGKNLKISAVENS